MDDARNLPEFGIKRENEERRDGGCAVVFDPKTQKYAVGERSESGLFILFGGGTNGDEDVKTAVLRELTEESGLHDFLHIEQIAEVLTHYHNAPKNVDRVADATCFLVILQSTDTIPTKLEAHETFSLRWATPEEISANWRRRNQNKDHDHWLYFLKKSVKRAIALGYDMTGKAD